MIIWMRGSILPAAFMFINVNDFTLRKERKESSG